MKWSNIPVSQIADYCEEYFSRYREYPSERPHSLSHNSPFRKR